MRPINVANPTSLIVVSWFLRGVQLKKRKFKCLLIAIVLFLFVSAVLIFSFQSPREQRSMYDNDIASSAVTDIRQLKYRLWPDDPQCRNHVVQFIRNCDRPPMALASYPGSGNTLVRGIIERLTGYFTGSVYSDSFLYTKGFYGEGMPVGDGCTVAQKTHHLPSDPSFGEESPYNPVNKLIIIRNPYKAILSLGHFVDTGNHVEQGEEDSFTGSGWNRFVSNEIASWRDRIIKWISTDGNLTRRSGQVNVIHYEKLIHDRENQFRKLFSIFQLPVDEERLACTIKHDFITFKRNSSRATTKDPYTIEQRNVIDDAIASVQSLLKFMKYDPLPLHLY